MTTDAASSTSNKKYLLIGLVAALIALLAAAGIWWVLDEPSVETPKAQVAPPKEVRYIALPLSRADPAFSVVVDGPHRQLEGARARYLMQVTVSIKVRGDAMRKLVSQHKSFIKARLNSLFLAQTYETATASGAKTLLELRANQLIKQEILSLGGAPEEIDILLDNMTIN